MASSVFSGTGTTKVADAVMHTLEKFINPKDVGMKTNLTENTQAAEVELLFIDRYFRDNWGDEFEVGYRDLVTDYNVTAVSIMNDYHRSAQAMKVMEAQRLDENKQESKGLIAKLLGQ